MQEGARHLPQIFPFLLILLVFLVPGILAAAQSQQQRSTPYSYQPLSPRAIPTVAIIGTAKAGTTDLYTLLTSTSQLAPGGQKKRTKEAKLLIEEGRTVKPGHADFHEYLLRIGHPCAASAHPNHSTVAVFQQCMQQLASDQAHANSSSTNTSIASSSSSSSSSSSRSQLLLSIDATPIYLALPQAVSALKAITHETKIIILLRHPVDRAESLYNHRVSTEHNKHLPARVMNKTISEWGQQFLDWVDSTPKVKPLLAALAREKQPQQQATIYQQLVELNMLGLPDGLPLTFPNYNRHGHIERNIFGSALYAGALGPWRAGYFRPGQVMVIDSHAFFARRLDVMNDVYEFVHGRPLSEAGRYIAQRTAVQNARRWRGIEFSGAKLDAAVKQRVSEFYRPHTELLLNEVLPSMEREGALVVGFQGPPWVTAQQH